MTGLATGLRAADASMSFRRCCRLFFHNDGSGDRLARGRCLDVLAPLLLEVRRANPAALGVAAFRAVDLLALFCDLGGEGVHSCVDALFLGCAAAASRGTAAPRGAA